MTYTEYKKVIEFLNIQLLQVVVKLDDEYKEFKKLDLITGYENIFKAVDNFLIDREPKQEYTILVEMDEIKLKNDYVVFWLDVNNYNLHSFQILETGNIIIGNMTIDSRNIVRNQMVLDFDAFVKLIS